MEYDLLTPRAAWKSLPPAAGASQGWASFHSELETLLQGWKNISWIWCFVAVCCNDSEELVPWDIRQVRKYREGCGLPCVCLVNLPCSSPSLCSLCQGLLEGFCKRNLGVVLIPYLSGKKHWKQLSRAHLEFDVPFTTLVGSASQKAPHRAGQSCQDRHSMHRELELSVWCTT